MKTDESGFTLIEILVALALAAMAMAAVYTTYVSQQKSYAVQQGVAEMQGNLRAAMHLMITELRAAGLDPTRKAKAAIKSVAEWDTTPDPDTPASIRFTADLDRNESISTAEDDSEDVTYTLDIANKNLTRTSGDGGPEVVAPNIEVLDLVFLDKDNNTTTTASDVASIQITLVARSPNKDNAYSTDFSYTNLQGTTRTIAGDGYRRTSLSSQVYCRNAAY